MMRTLMMSMLLGAVLLGGCVENPKAGCETGEQAVCPVCGKEMPEDAFCPQCNAVANCIGEFKCASCDKTVKAGTYCPKHNKFRFPAAAGKCPKCGKVKGEWCETCGHYAMLPHITYDAEAKKPVRNSSAD